MSSDREDPGSRRPEDAAQWTDEEIRRLKATYPIEAVEAAHGRGASAGMTSLYLRFWTLMYRQNPGDRQIHEGLSRLWRVSGSAAVVEPDGRRTQLLRALEALKGLAEAAESAGATDLLIGDLQRMGELDPSNLVLRGRLATLLRRTGRVDEAVDVHLEIAEGLRQRGHLKEARQVLEMARSLRPASRRVGRALQKARDEKRPVETGLLTAIQQATGGVLIEVREPVRGAVSPSGHVAWIEGGTEERGMARLRVAARGQILLDRNLTEQDESAPRLESCTVDHLQWSGDRVVAVARRGKAISLLAISPDGDAHHRALTTSWAIEGNLVFWVDDVYPGLIRCLSLPSLERRTPLFFRGTAVRAFLKVDGDDLTVTVEDGEALAPAVVHQECLRLPASAQRSWPGSSESFVVGVGRRLFEDQPTASQRLLLEASVAPFCAGPADAHPTPPAPLWLPFHWYRHLVSTGRPEQAARHLATLDAAASPLDPDEPERGWHPGWSYEDGAETIATRYVRRQARIQAAACRAGALPEGWCCPLDDREKGGPGRSHIVPEALTPEVRRALERMRWIRPQGFHTVR